METWVVGTVLLTTLQPPCADPTKPAEIREHQMPCGLHVLGGVKGNTGLEGSALARPCGGL